MLLLQFCCSPFPTPILTVPASNTGTWLARGGPADHVAWSPDAETARSPRWQRRAQASCAPCGARLASPALPRTTGSCSGPSGIPASPQGTLAFLSCPVFSAPRASSLLTPSPPSLVPVGRGLVSSHLSTQHSLPHLEGHRLPGGLRVRLSGFPSRACAWFSRRGQDDRAAVLQTRAVPWEDPGGPCPTGRVRSPTGQKQRAS